MVLALPFPLFLAEVLLFFWFSSIYGFWYVLGAYWAPSLLGWMILSFQSQSALFTLQRRIAQGHSPTVQGLSLVAKFASGVLFVIPLVSSRILGLILLFPVTRRLAILVLQGWIARKLATGGFRFASRGFGGFGGFGGGMPPPVDYGPRVERDAQVIDIKPIERK